MKKVTEEWSKRGTLDKTFLDFFRKFLSDCPDNDGLKRVTYLPTGKTYLVPYEDLILYGLKGNEVTRYPEEKQNAKDTA
jgi:hypothetical protein